MILVDSCARIASGYSAMLQETAVTSIEDSLRSFMQRLPCPSGHNLIVLCHSFTYPREGSAEAEQKRYQLSQNV